MGLFHSNKKKSIVNIIRYTFIIIIIIMSAGFMFSIYIKDNTLKEYDEFIGMNIKLSNLSVEFSNSWNYYDTYMKTKNIDYYNKYREANAEIDQIIDELEPFIEKDKDSEIYLRTLDNMFDSYKKESQVLVSERNFGTQEYNELIELKTLVMYINKQSELLTLSYLNYSNVQYSKTLVNNKNAESRIYMILIYIIMISFISALAISKHIRSTIDRLCEYAKLLSNAQWDIPDIREQSYEELNSLAKAFNNLKNSIRNFIDELNKKAEIENRYNKEKLKNAEKDKLIKETQLKALQMQMNPHFLFNTLNTIGRMAMFEGAKDTVGLIEATSKILRYNLNFKDKLVKLREELDMVIAYALIQETRFQDQMCFKFDIDKNLEYINIPPMTIQPIVENAIIHGLKEKDCGGVINISVKKESGFAIISVEDNGKGIEEKCIDKILNNESSSKESGHTTGLGLSNVRKRLELYFDRKDLITINSIVEQGCKVRILIPVKVGE